MKMPPAEALALGPLTILSYGALLSESSARLTFPALRNFRLARVQGLRRTFAHPHTFLISRKLADPAKTLKIGSLSVEAAAESSGLVVAAFDIDCDAEQRVAFVKREPEYDFAKWPFTPLDPSHPPGSGVICMAGEDATLRSEFILPEGLETVWGWKRDSGLLPADIYLRHCLLAVEKAGPDALASFLDETFLCDRETALRKYVDATPSVMDARPPFDLLARFSG